MGLGTRQHIRLGAQVSEIWCVIKTQMLLRRLDEVGQLLHEVSQLLYEVHLLTASGGVVVVKGCGTSSVGKYTTSFNVIVSIPYVI